MSEATITSYRVRRSVFLGGKREPKGELIPEAKRFFRLDNIVHAGNLQEVKVTQEELLEAIARRCPERLDELIQSYALDDNVYRQGPHGVPTMRAGTTKLAGNVQKAVRTPPVKVDKPAKAPAKQA